jgi:hypothetical protein
MLASSGSGTTEGTTKALALLGCNADPAKARRRRHEGVGSYAAGSNLHGVGFRAVESIPALGKALPFAG